MQTADQLIEAVNAYAQAQADFVVMQAADVLMDRVYAHFQAADQIPGLPDAIATLPDFVDAVGAVGRHLGYWS